MAASHAQAAKLADTLLHLVGFQFFSLQCASELTPLPLRRFVQALGIHKVADQQQMGIKHTKRS